MAWQHKPGFLSAILLSAGESSRMGQLKALLPWYGTTLVEFQTQSLIKAGADQVIVVTGHRGEEIEDLLAESYVDIVHNPDFLKGKTTSIKAGLKAVDPRADAILFLSVDQPRPANLIAKVIREHYEHQALITSPRHEGKGGHPIIMSAALLPELLTIDEASHGLRAVFERHRSQVHQVQMKSEIILLDLNTPVDYRRAISLFESNGAKANAG